MVEIRNWEKPVDFNHIIIKEDCNELNIFDHEDLFVVEVENVWIVEENEINVVYLVVLKVENFLKEKPNKNKNMVIDAENHII